MSDELKARIILTAGLILMLAGCLYAANVEKAI